MEKNALIGSLLTQVQLTPEQEKLARRDLEKLLDKKGEELARNLQTATAVTYDQLFGLLTIQHATGALQWTIGAAHQAGNGKSERSFDTLS